jgi:hypothetical protein
VRAGLVAGLLLLLTAVGGAEEIRLRDGTVLRGEIVEQAQDSLTVRVPIETTTPSGGRITGSGDRKIPWGHVETIDGLGVADWLRGGPEPEVARAAVVEASGAPPDPLGFRETVERFGGWMEEGEGMGVAVRLGVIVLLVLVPALLLLGGGRALRVEHLEAYRAFGGAIFSVGATVAVIRIWPGWFGGLPLAAIAVGGLVLHLVVRPPLGRGLVLAVAALAGSAGVVFAVVRVTEGLG